MRSLVEITHLRGRVRLRERSLGKRLRGRVRWTRLSHNAFQMPKRGRTVSLMRVWVSQVLANPRRKPVSVQSCNATLTLLLPQIPRSWAPLVFCRVSSAASASASALAQWALVGTGGLGQNGVDPRRQSCPIRRQLLLKSSKLIPRSRDFRFLAAQGPQRHPRHICPSGSRRVELDMRWREFDE